MRVEDKARVRAQNLYQSDQFVEAYVAGAVAASKGRRSSACPYPREQQRRTWRTSFRVAWMRGHGSVWEEGE